MIIASQNWLEYLANGVTDPKELLKKLSLPIDDFQQHIQARQLFPFRVPQPFIDKMEKGNPLDPLFLQVMPRQEEFLTADDFIADPLQEQQFSAPNLLHKYYNRVLLMVKSGCAVNCRYCFRRHFPYQQNKGNKLAWQQALDYIEAHHEIEEVILSGGDPLMAKDEELDWLLNHIDKIDHITRLRIHTRLPVVIPQRITQSLCELLKNSRLSVVFVTHINHPNEIDSILALHIKQLHNAGVIILNQSVILKNVNDDAQILKQLSEKLFDSGIFPYYLHFLDKVKGASHFYIDDENVFAIYRQLQAITSGYLVPKLARELPHEPNKTLYGV